MFYTKCGNKLNQGQKFCTNCGEAVSNENMKISDDFKGQAVLNKGIDEVKNLEGNLKNQDLHKEEVKSKVVNNDKDINEEKYQKSDNNKLKNKIIIVTSIIVVIGLAVTGAYVIKSKYSDKSNKFNDKASEDKVVDKKSEVNQVKDKDKEDKPQDNNVENK